MRFVFYAALLVAVTATSSTSRSKPASSGYEVWASDQSNSVPGQSALGVKGSFLWIWDSDDIEQQLNGGGDAVPLPCTPGTTEGPCDLMAIFPQDLVEYKQEEGELLGSPTGKTLAELPLFGRLHGVIKDPQERYVNANIFAKGGGYVGIIDTQTKEAIGLFRVPEYSYATSSGTSTSRSVHMSFWTDDGSAVIVANLHGKAIERINVERDNTGSIIQLSFDRSATLGLGRDMVRTQNATFFQGDNAFGNPLLGELVGSYDDADIGDLTPNGLCKENGCSSGPNGSSGGRGNNLPICPIVSQHNFVYNTLAGGGLLVADGTTTPMSIVGEYGNNEVYGAGCGGVQIKDTMFVNSGVSASGAGATQSMFALWAFQDSDFLDAPVNGYPENTPAPELVFEDEGNTATGGNMVGEPVDSSGQLPGITTRRDSHGASATTNDKFLHVVDRIQGVVEVFDAESFSRGTYDLQSFSGQNGFNGRAGGCLARSVSDDPGLPTNDPSPDLFERTPDGKYMMIAFRGPHPVSVPHGAQGSCPGVGVVDLTPQGNLGRLVDVLSTTNTVPDTVPPPNAAATGGHAYTGTERSDIHGCIVVSKA